MSKETYVYVTYIATTPEKLWDALINGAMTKQYWKHNNISDWKPGSRWEHQRSDKPGVVDLVGKVLEADHPRRLVITWAYPADEGSPEKSSRVTFEIDTQDGTTRLTVIHDDLEPASKMLQGITRGWPIVLSGLKTLLETGKPLSLNF
jgi:uncharacterized protein YndB with AHSA1/START domain